MVSLVPLVPLGSLQGPLVVAVVEVVEGKVRAAVLRVGVEVEEV
jgi:hypothetical protein